MLQSEFETRVQMPVSTKEYAAIEEVYTNSDLQKDEFCKVWAKMNASRIKAYKEQQAQLAKEEEQRDRLFSLYQKLNYSNMGYKMQPASTTLKSSEKRLCESVGVQASGFDKWGGIILVSDVCYQLGKYLKIIK